MSHLVRCHGRVSFLPIGPGARLRVNTIAETNVYRSQIQLQRRGAGTTRRSSVKAAYLQTSSELGERLKATAVWDKRYNRNMKKSKISGDSSRINIVNEDLVKDMVEYIKPSLERHKGCDLISVYPGAGAWNKALHDAVQPRSHLLLEPDEELYTPFLQDLLNKDGVRLLPKSGIVWKDLEEVLTPENLPNQVPVSRNLSEPPPRNDTLLVTLNLAMFPKKKFQMFESMSRMVVYQLIASMRNSTLFQKYGQVRMLIWVPDDEKHQILPRVLHHRKRMAIEGELCTEYIAEVCGTDGVFEDGTNGFGTTADKAAEKFKRFGQLELESIRLTLLRMKEKGYITPKGRETFIIETFRELGLSLTDEIPLVDMLSIVDRKSQKEYDTLTKQNAKKPFAKDSREFKRFNVLKAYLIWQQRTDDIAIDMVREFDKVIDAFKRLEQAETEESREQLKKETEELDHAFNVRYDKYPKYLNYTIGNGRDQIHLLRQPKDLGPVLCWDRRPYEPLPVSPHDFFPNIPSALLDFQPAAPHPLLREMGPGTRNSGDIFDMILGILLQSCKESVVKQLDIVWPGTVEGVVPHCPSLTDLAKGGSPLKGAGATSSRVANRVQLMEVLEAFINWPFRPSYPDMVGRLAEEKFVDESTAANDDEGPGGVMGNNTMDAF